MSNHETNFSSVSSQYTDKKLEEMWEEFANIPVVEDADSLAESSLEGLSVKEGGVLLHEEPYIDKNFYWWLRGTTRDAIWHWFDSHYSRGLYALMHMEEKRNSSYSCIVNQSFFVE